jgi:hypothetical protein
MTANRRIGENGDETETFPTANSIAAAFGGSDSGLTLAKLAEMQRLWDVMRAPKRGRCLIYSSAQLSDLINDVVEVKSTDYIARGVVETRKMPDNWLGFERFIQYEELDADATDTDAYVCLGFIREHMVAFDGEYRFNVDVLPGVSHATQLRPRARIGAVRKQNSVLRVLCQHDSLT